MNKTACSTLMLLLVCVTLAACGSPAVPGDQTTQTIPAAPVARDTAVPTATQPATPTPTCTPTETPAATSTPTPSPSPTPTSSPTLTPSATPAPSPAPTNPPTPTAVATAAQPVPTPIPTTPRSQPHVFPETPIQAFDAEVFVRYLGLVRDSFRSAADEFPQIFSGSKKGDCGSYIGWIALWVTEAPGFEDVPPAWFPLYAEYRALIQEAVTTTWEINQVCGEGGGTVSDETDAAAQAFIERAYPRSEQMVLDALQLPRP